MQQRLCFQQYFYPRIWHIGTMHEDTSKKELKNSDIRLQNVVINPPKTTENQTHVQAET